MLAAPNVIIDAHNRRDSAYRLLRQANLQLIALQQKHGIPISVKSVDESEPDDTTTDGGTITDISILLGQELIKSKVCMSYQSSLISN